MSESLSQGIPSLQLNDKGIKLYKINDISFSGLRSHFEVGRSKRKPDQLVGYGKRVLVGIEEKDDVRDMGTAIKQISDYYLEPLPQTRYFIARAGEHSKLLYRLTHSKLITIGSTLRGREVLCFGPRVITGENVDAITNLSLLSLQILQDRTPINGSLELQPPKEYYNPLIVKESVIRSLWQKIFVCTGENAHTCLATFVELLLYKGISDAGMLPLEFSIGNLAEMGRKSALNTYVATVRQYIRTRLFPTVMNQPGVINGFAFNQQETVFKSVLQDLNDLGNLAQRQIDPDFKRRVMEAFLGSAHKDGTIRSGKHLTPRNIIQAVWEMADPKEGSRIVDPACGVGGFVLEGFNYPYEFSPLSFNCFGADRDEQMIITAKANMILHILDKFADPEIDNKELANKINSTFLKAENNGTGTLGELERQSGTLKARHDADYVFANVPFYVNGVKQIDNSLDDIGLYSFYKSCGIGVESRFVKYILSQIEKGNPGVAFVIVTDGILYRLKDKIRQIVNEKADMLGIISLPAGAFQNNNWKTSVLIFKKKASTPEYAPVFLYNVESIGVSLDSYRTPTQDNDIPSLKTAWRRRHSGSIDDPKCKLVPRNEFLTADKWSDLFAWCRQEDDENTISVSEFVESARDVREEISTLLNATDKTLGDVFALDDYIEILLDDTEYFETGTANFKATVRYARHHPGDYPLFSSQVDGPVEHMHSKDYSPILEGKDYPLISWNIKGDPCKDVRMHTEPFYVTENRGLIRIINENINFEYVLYYLREHMISMGKFSRSNEAHVGKVKRLKIKIPATENGVPDLSKQKEIATSYERVMELKAEMSQKVQELQSLVDSIDVFK